MTSMTSSSLLPPFFGLKAQTWHAAVQVSIGLKDWLFRGHSDPRWKLTSSLERAASRSQLGISKQLEMEEEILSQFKRQAHQHLPSPPVLGDSIEWLSLIQ